MAQLEDDVVKDFFHRLNNDDQISSRVARDVQQVFKARSVPNSDAIVNLIEAVAAETVK